MFHLFEIFIPKVGHFNFYAVLTTSMSQFADQSSLCGNIPMFADHWWQYEPPSGFNTEYCLRSNQSLVVCPTMESKQTEYPAKRMVALQLV